MTLKRSSQVVMPETRRPQSWPGASMLGLVIGLACILFSGSHVWAAPTTADQAAAVVRGWLRHSTQPMNMPLGTAVGQVETFNDEQNQPAYYIVHVTTNGVPTSFVIVSADDEVEPIIGFVQGSTYDPSPANPLGALVSKDLPGRLKAAREVAGQAALTTGPAGKQAQKGGKGGDRSSIASRGKKPAVAPKVKWRRLAGELEAGSSQLSFSIGDPIYDPSEVSDVRVGPLVQSQWDQGEIAGSPCYNYYTPNNHVCGCVATAMAQVMRFWQHPTAGIGVHTYQVYVNGVPQYRDTRGGDEDPQGKGLGGPYRWADMPLVPDSTLTTDQRKAIGALCHDAGVTVSMQYASDGSGALPSAPVVALTERFGYARAVDNLQASNSSFDLNVRMNPSLDAGCPCLLSIRNPWGGHHVVVDGYGYNSSTLYHHLNLGWGPDEYRDGWYNLPSVHGVNARYMTSPSCTYNISPVDTREIISGRTLDSTGAVVAGVTVTAQRNGGGTYTATSDSNGIYALRVPSNGTYTLTAAYIDPVTSRDYSLCTLVENVGTSSTSANTCGSVWAADFPPVPPAALDGSVLTHFNAPVTIRLRASDDGQPNPSQALTYIVTSLPSHGDLREPQGSVINSVPYTLTNQSHQLVYTPATGFLGSDGFAFKTNDGGTPPDGGDSEEASISIEVSNAFYQETVEGSSINSWTLGKFYFSGIESGGWYWGPPIGTGYPGYPGWIGVGPRSAHSGDNLLYTNYTEQAYHQHEATTYARTPAIDCRGYTNVKLHFWRWLEVSFWSNWAEASIDVSTNGTTWNRIWNNTHGQTIDDNGWTFQSYDLDVAANQPTVYIRWGVEPTYADAGWSIDDVELVGDGVPSNPTPADGAEDVSIDSTLSWTACLLVGASGSLLNAQYDVYFGTSNPPTTLVASDLSDTTWDPGMLQERTTYYWKVVAKADSRQTESAVWQFTTVTPPVHNLTRDSYWWTIQAAINDVPLGGQDVIEVSPGTCHERINFGGKNITVRSTYLTNPDAVATTIIDGGAGGTVVTFAGTETAASLRGLSITNGLGDEGGGIYGAPAGCTIDHCVIYGNQADYGGGIASCDATIQDCTIRDNYATFGGGLGACGGPIRRCVIQDNQTESWSWGGGACDCSQLSDCTIIGNSAGWGGGVSNSSVDNCLIAGNQADSGGGGVFSNGGVVRNCTIVGNSADLYGGGGVNADSGAVSIINCIVRDNIFGDVNAVGAQLSVLDNVLHVSYSNIAGGQAKVLLEGATLDWLTGNIDTDPLFVDPDGADNSSATYADNNYHLRRISPCVNAGDPAGNYTGQTDIDGEARVAYAVVDMGADEVLDTTILPVRNVWRDTYWSTIQAAINAAIDGDEIEVSSGTYQEQITIDCNIMIRSTDPTNSAVVEAATIDGNFAGTVVTFALHRTTGANLAAAKLSGLSIVNGFTQGLDGVPAGINGAPAGCTIDHCLIYCNQADIGGGIGNCQAAIEDCTICFNQAGIGGGLCNCTGPVRRCIIRANHAMDSGFYGGGFGGGAYGCPQISASTIADNGADYWGGGVCLSDVDSCVIAGNWAGGGGGGIHACGGTVRNCTIVGNSAGYWGGGGVYADSAPLTILNCIVRDNSFGGVDAIGAQLTALDSTLHVSYGDIAGGQAKVLLDGASLDWQAGNIDADPLFVDPDGIDGIATTYIDNDYHLTGASPCINAGDPAGSYAGQTDIDGDARVMHGQVDIGADEFSGIPLALGSAPSFTYEGWTVSLTASASSGYGYTLTYDWTQTSGKQVVNLVSDPETGDLSFTVPTLELTSDVPLKFTVTVTDGHGGSVTSEEITVPAYLLGDVNGDGYVDVIDLLTIAAVLDGGPGYTGPEDLNRDGYVNEADLQLLSANWGRFLEDPE